MAGVQMLPLRLEKVRRVDAEHVGSREREGARGHGTGDHPGQVEDEHARKGRGR